MSNDTSDPTASATAPETPAAPAPAADAPADLEALSAQAAKAAEYYERLVRMTADFDNFKKRVARERDELRRNTTEGIITRLLPVLDNFEMAMAAANQPGVSVDAIKAGVTMIQGQLRGVFTEQGLEEVNAQGQAFDPSLHEAVEDVETADVPEGHVAKQLRKGYRLRERLLRPATVVVARAAAPAAPAAPVDPADLSAAAS